MRHILFAILTLTSLSVAGVTGKLVAGDTIVSSGDVWRLSVESSLSSLDVRGRALIEKNKQQPDSLAWNLIVEDRISGNKIRVSIKRNSSENDDEIIRSRFDVRCGLFDKNGAMSRELRLPPEVAGTIDDNAFLSVSILWNDEGEAEVMIGDNSPFSLGCFSFGNDIKEVAVIGNVAVEIMSMNIRKCEGISQAVKSIPVARFYDVIAGKRNDSPAADPFEGVYEYLDSDIDMERCHLGGHYCLGVIRNDDGGYSIIYLGGAEENSSSWTPGMIKGVLRPTIFRNHFNLEWIDAEMSDDMDELWGQFDGVVMELHFPKERGVVRFCRKNIGDDSLERE